MDHPRLTFASPGRLIAAAWVARLLALLVVVVVVVGATSFMSAGALAADAGTTRTYDYDPTDAPTASCVTAASPAARPAHVALPWSAAPSNYGYDDRLNVARTSARPGVEVVAPQTAIGEPCVGMLVYRVYGPDSGAGEFGASWSPIDPRTIGPADYRDLAGLPDSNPGTHLVIGELIDPSAVAEVREALECDDPHCADYRPGGLLEFLIPSNPATVVNRTYQPLYPPY